MSRDENSERRPRRGRESPQYATDGERLDARDRVADAPLTPGVRPLRAVMRTEGLPTAIGDVLLLDAAITEGRPMHGALRSDDHVSALEVVAPLDVIQAESSHDVPGECPECGHTRGRYSYSAHHHIAGSDAVTCAVCDHEHAAETWG